MQFNLDQSIEILGQTPLVLENLLIGLSEEWIQNNEGAETWSPYNIVGHLIHGEKTDWIPRAVIILSPNADKSFELFDRFAQFRESEGKTLKQLLDEFKILRKQNIQHLRSMEITEADLTKVGKHPAFGAVTLKQLIATWMVHDLNHISQICRVMAKQYKDEVGPWSAYLGILK